MKASVATRSVEIDMQKNSFLSAMLLSTRMKQNRHHHLTFNSKHDLAYELCVEYFILDRDF